MIGWTLCSGIGAPEVAAPWVDWRLGSEIEPFPRAVLQHRLGYAAPEDHNQGDPLLWGDMTEVSPELARSRGVPLPDVLVAGTPCQAFSVAGLRRGTADARGNLTLKFVEICHAIVNARPDGRLAVLWENVPGVLSDKGNAFGCFLGGLVGSDDPLQPPAGEGWPGAGMVSGPRARLAWRVLDAQHFGVPQRRRRVFLVADFGEACDPAEVLFERQGVRGHPAPRRQAGQDVAGTLSARTDGGGGLGTDFELGGGLQPVECYGGGNTAGPLDVAACLTAKGQRVDFEVETFAIQERAVAENPASGPDGLGVRSDGLAYTLEARTTAQAVCATGNRPHALTAEGHDASGDGTGRGTPVVAFHNRQDPDVSGDVTHPLGAQDNGLGVWLPWAVRRLMPVECERLQGFPDNHTLIPYGVSKKIAADELAFLRSLSHEEMAGVFGVDPDTMPPVSDEELRRLAADGPRYKALGNSMAVPCMGWILERLAESAGWATLQEAAE